MKGRFELYLNKFVGKQSEVILFKFRNWVRKIKIKQILLKSSSPFQISNFKFLILSLFFLNSLLAQDYSFDFEDFEKKPYEYVGNFQLQSDLASLNKLSKLYSLSFSNKDEQGYFDSYFASIQLKGSYDISKFKLLIDIKDQLSYNTNDEVENTFNIFESYLNTYISKNINFQIGKKSVKWGKGYIWNPVSFIGRQKDINDVDAALEGFWMLKFDYVKSLSGVLQNFSITTVLMPVNRDFNEGFSEEDGFNYILNNYFLIKDTDIDFYFFWEDTFFKKFGFDFARNILPSWEIHAEYVFEKNVIRSWWNSQTEIESSTNNTHNYLFGTRILFETNTTLIAEYLHNDAGFETEQMIYFFKTIDVALSSDQSLLPEVKEYQLENFNNQFLMQDYFYLKLIQPEPFNILYFTPSIYLLYNINDESKMIGGEFNYSRFNNLDLKIKYTFLSGNANSEFGEKTTFNKISFLMDYTF